MHEAGASYGLLSDRRTGMEGVGIGDGGTARHTLSTVDNLCIGLRGIRYRRSIFYAPGLTTRGRAARMSAGLRHTVFLGNNLCTRPEAYIVNHSHSMHVGLQRRSWSPVRYGLLSDGPMGWVCFVQYGLLSDRPGVPNGSHRRPHMPPVRDHGSAPEFPRTTGDL